MSRKKRQFKFVRLLLVLLIVCALAVCIFFGIKLVYSKINEAPEKKEDIKEVSDTNEEVSIEVVDYKIFVDSDDELGFNFILADLKFTSKNTPIFYDLANLSTSERINLGNIEFYETKIQAIGIELSKLNYVKNVRADDSNSVTCKVLIPYEKIKGELNVYNGEVLKFDLNANNINVGSLKVKEGQSETIILSNDYNISVFDSYISNMMFRNDEKAKYPATVDIYTFELKVNSITKENICIEEATFIPNGSSNNHNSLDESYSSAKIENIIGKPLKIGDTYALFFAVTNSRETKESFNGKLLIKFSDNANLIEISTVKENND